MPRDKKARDCCRALPDREYQIRGQEGAPAMELETDEVEALRLVDLEELDQAAAAARMGISRGTLQRLLWAARHKVAFALLAGRGLRLRGAPDAPGDGDACPRAREGKCRFCRFKSASPTHRKGGKKMETKIAVTCENDEVFQHFGHTPEFAVFTVNDGKIVKKETLPTNGTGHGALAGFLKAAGVGTLLCGGIGGGAQMALAEAGIALVGGVSGKVDAAVAAYLAGTLAPAPDFQCHHHDHEASHRCGEHGCGGGSCH